MRDPWKIAALVLGAVLYWQMDRCRRAEARAARPAAGTQGMVDLDPVFDHLEGAMEELAAAGGLRRSSTPVHCAERPALRVLP